MKIIGFCVKMFIGIIIRLLSFPGVTQLPTQWWCSTAETLKATWPRFSSTKTSTWAKSTSSTSGVPPRKCTTTHAARSTTPAWWTWCGARKAGSAARRRTPRAGTTGRTRRSWTAAAASRAGRCRSGCRSCGRPCCACCAARRRSTPPSAPAVTWCAARAAPTSCRWERRSSSIGCLCVKVTESTSGLNPRALNSVWLVELWIHDTFSDWEFAVFTDRI